MGLGLVGTGWVYVGFRKGGWGSEGRVGDISDHVQLGLGQRLAVAPLDAGIGVATAAEAGALPAIPEHGPDGTRQRAVIFRDRATDGAADIVASAMGLHGIGIGWGQRLVLFVSSEGFCISPLLSHPGGLRSRSILRISASPATPCG